MCLYDSTKVHVQAIITAEQFIHMVVKRLDGSVWFYMTAIYEFNKLELRQCWTTIEQLQHG